MSGSPQAGPAPLSGHEDKLLACIHCGFCLSTCPTYTRLGNEADSPRGRLFLMRAVAEQRVAPSSPGFHKHIDACVGCRACETVCPAAVEFGFLLQRARKVIADHRGMDLRTRLLLFVFGSVLLTRVFGVIARLLRRLPTGRSREGAAPKGLFASARFGLRMLRRSAPASVVSHAPAAALPAATGAKVALLEGCAQSALYGHVNEATRRVLTVNGCQLLRADGQGCCGALHAHAGDLPGAKRLAARNIAAFEKSGAELIVTNSAGCGAALKEYPELFDEEPLMKPRAEAFSARVRDVNELLLALTPKRGAEVPLKAGYDAPCHLQHGQGLGGAPVQLLKAVPGLQVTPIPRADECCGGAGIYGLLHPDLGGKILADKVGAVKACGADVCVTANPGCMLQIGAGLDWFGSETPVLHVVELLDESYRRAGYYGTRRD